MTLTAAERETYARAGHLTIPGIFTPTEMDRAIADIEAWGEAFLAALSPEQRGWYVDGGVTARTVLRKLDNPVQRRPAIRALAAKPALVERVEALIGPGVSVYFSQVFFKPPEGGGPKPMHQDNWYFGPADPDGMVTAWIALDDATVENGCLFFSEGSHRGPVHAHVTPPGEPFNLQVPGEVAAAAALTPAPVPKGGVSFHHGGILHQSGDNRSSRWRRAIAMHYVTQGNDFVTPTLPYDKAAIVPITARAVA